MSTSQPTGLGRVLGDTQVTATEFRMANSWDPPGKGFHPGVPLDVGGPSFSLGYLCSKKSLAKKAGGLDVLGTWRALCFAVS